MDSGPPTPDILPHVAVVICTRHRPPSIADTVRSALASRPAASCVIVVDQADADMPDPLAEFDGLARFVRIRHDAVGLSRGRNVGTAAAAAAGATIVAYTDDDCVAGPSWLSGFDAAFAGDADVAAVFGTVRAAAYDRTTGIIPAYEVRKPAVLRGLGNSLWPRVSAHAWPFASMPGGSSMDSTTGSGRARRLRPAKTPT